MTALISSNGYPKTSCSTNAALSAGARASRTTCIAPPIRLGEQRVGLRVDRRGVGGCLGLGIGPGASLAEVVQAQPRHDGRQPGGQVVDVFDAGEPQPGLLHHVVRIGLRPEYPAGDRSQPGSFGVEFGHIHDGHIILTRAASGM